MLYDKIEKLCAEKGISVTRLEKECGLGNATVRNWNESAPRANNLLQVANYLEIPIEELMKEVNDTSKIRNQ